MIALQSRFGVSFTDGSNYSGKRNANYSKEGLYEPFSAISYYNSIGDVEIKPSRLEEVFVCMSPEYLKKEFHYLYFLLIDLASNILGREAIRIF